MQTFHDYDIDHPFLVEDEKHTITDGKIRLNYIPQIGSVSISGFTEGSSSDVGENEFFIDYSVRTQYRMATGFVQFGGHEGEEVSVSYKGVSTLILAKHMNEIKDFMENQKDVGVSNDGEVAAITGEEADKKLKLGEINSNGYSIPEGNVITLGGTAGAQIAVGFDTEGNQVLCFRARKRNSDKWGNWVDMASLSYVASKINELVGTAPEALDTLNELSDAIGNDPNFSATITSLIGKKLDASGGTITGDLTVEGAINGNVTGNVSGSSGSCKGNAETATNATNDAEGNNIKETYFRKDGGNVSGQVTVMDVLSVGSEGSGEGGEIHLKAADGATSQAGITIDQAGSTLRIFGIGSADGSIEGAGTILVIDPYHKTITGGYTFTGNINGKATSASKDENGKSITSYVSDVTISGRTVTVTWGDGSKTEFQTEGQTYDTFGNGKSGLVPAASGTDATYLCNNATWRTITEMLTGVDIHAKTADSATTATSASTATTATNATNATNATTAGTANNIPTSKLGNIWIA